MRLISLLLLNSFLARFWHNFKNTHICLTNVLNALNGLNLTRRIFTTDFKKSLV